MSTWNYAQNGKPCGPVETAVLADLLRNRTLAPDSLVWKPGMANWAAANTLPEFANIFSAPAAPPPLPMLNNPAAPPPASGFGVPPLGGQSNSFRNAPPVMSARPASAADPVTADIEQNKVFAVLAYLGILFLVPLLAAPKSPFARYHTNQGIVLFLAAIVAHFASLILVFFTFGIGFFLPLVVWVVIIVYIVLGIVNAASGQCKPLPLIGHFELMK